MAKLKAIRSSRPLFTNASRNRFAALDCVQAGIPVAEIAAHWPQVWKLDHEGKLGMKVSMVYPCGTTETLIQMRGVEEFIANWKKRHG